MKFKEMEKLIKADGWQYKNTNGSHYQYKHPTKTGKVTIPFKCGDLNKKTIQSIKKQAGI